MSSRKSVLSPILFNKTVNQNGGSSAYGSYVLFISYDGLLDPLGQSQILPYIDGLRERGFRFAILSFEKDHRDSHEIEGLRDKLHAIGITWFPLVFVSGGGFKRFFRRIVMGARELREICHSENIDFLHLRGFAPAFIFKLSFLKIPYIYDYRSFTVDEWAEAGLIKSGSVSYRLLKTVDRMAIRDMSALVTLEKSAENLLRKTYSLRDIPASIIRTSTDCKRYLPKITRADKESIRFVHLGGALFPYQVDVVLKFVKIFSEVIGDVSICFINEGQHNQLEEAIEKSLIDQTLVFVESVKHELIPVRLAEFDAGLIFIEPSPCRRVCSPTKLGEYLAAGLPVIAGKGIDVLHEIERDFNCVKTIDLKPREPFLSSELIYEVRQFIKDESQPERCQKVARIAFDVNSAIDKYSDLYNSLECKLHN